MSENRLLAKEWARDIMKTLNAPIADRPFVEAVLVEAALFENPIKELAIGINEIGPLINITIKGYENMIDLVSWVNLFMSNHRDKMLTRVCNTFLQTPPDEGAILVIQMEKVTFHTSGEEGGKVEKHATRKRRTE